MSAQPTAFLAPANPADELNADVQRIIRQHEASRARSQQTDIGPSGVGEECVRKIGYQLAGIAKSNWPDPWAAYTGTGVHSMLEKAFDHDDAVSPDPDRWLVETKVHVTDTLYGSVDLYDRLHHRVIDHKTSGATGMKRYRSHGPKPQQLIQLGLYAIGMERAGHQVDSVGLVFYPLGGRLDGIHVWTSDFTPELRQMALDALARLDTIRALVEQLDLAADPSRIAVLPATTSKLCEWCPYYRYRSPALSSACPGGSA